MNERTDVIVNRMYSKGAHRVGLFIRQISGGDISGTVFRFETWIDNQEVGADRQESGDKYFIRKKYFAKLLDLLEDNWKRETMGVTGHSESSFFNPEIL